MFEPKSLLALETALACGRPLLVRGEPGLHRAHPGSAGGHRRDPIEPVVGRVERRLQLGPLPRALGVPAGAAVGGHQLAGGIQVVVMELKAAISVDYAEQMAQAIERRTGLPFVSAPNKFAVMAGKEALVTASAAMRTAAAALNKIANDVRWLASGPRCGIGEIPDTHHGTFYDKGVDRLVDRLL